MAEKKEAKSVEKVVVEKKSVKKAEKKEYKQQVIQLWGASLVVALLFLMVSGAQAFYAQEEASIRRESYLANLVQLYRQELQECSVQQPLAVEGEDLPASEGAQQCLERINEEGEYAKLVKKWGGEDRLLKTLN